MSLWSKVIRWIDADMSPSFFLSAPPSLAVGLIPLLALGIPAAMFPQPCRLILLTSGFLLMLVWAGVWFWRALLYLRSTEYREMLDKVRRGS